MYFDVIDVKSIGDYNLRVKFHDNLEGIVRVHKDWLTGIFAPLLKQNVFDTVYVDKDSCAVSWNIDGETIDLAPDTMYSKIKNNSGIYELK